METDLDALSSHPAIQDEVSRHITTVNARLARYETMKKWTVLPVPLVTENGYLTPTLKLRRRAIIADFGAQLESLYEENAPEG